MSGKATPRQDAANEHKFITAVIALGGTHNDAHDLLRSLAFRRSYRREDVGQTADKVRSR